jgi:hypothetical protein
MQSNPDLDFPIPAFRLGPRLNLKSSDVNSEKYALRPLRPREGLHRPNQAQSIMSVSDLDKESLLCMPLILPRYTTISYFSQLSMHTPARKTFESFRLSLLPHWTRKLQARLSNSIPSAFGFSPGNNSRRSSI